jgi:hypothetical protein
VSNPDIDRNQLAPPKGKKVRLTGVGFGSLPLDAKRIIFRV